MELKDLLQIYMMSAQNLDSLWEFYVTIHLGVFGAFFVLHRLALHQLMIFWFSYILFLLINTRAKVKEYEIYSSLISDLKVTMVNEKSHIGSFFMEYDVSDRIWITYIVHLFSLIVVTLLCYKSWRSK